MASTAQFDQEATGRTVIVGATFLAVLPLSTDIVLVALPIIAGSFGAPLSAGHQIMSFFVIGLALAHLFVGALADRFGRRVVALVGYGIYTLASLGAIASTSLEVLLAFRLLQGLSGACGPILMRAMVRDLAASGDSTRQLATIGTISGIAPLIAPILGIVVSQAFGWQSSFAVLALYGAATFILVLAMMQETLDPVVSRFSLITPTLARTLLSDRQFLLGSLAMACGYGALLSWLSTGSYWLTTSMGLDPLIISIVYATGSLGFMLGGYFAMRSGFSSGNLIRIGVSMGMIGGGASLVIALALPGSFWACLPIMLFYAGWGIAQPQAINLAMRNNAAIAGKASALLGLVQLGGGVILSWIVVLLGAGAAAPAMMMAASVGILLAARILAPEGRAV